MESERRAIRGLTDHGETPAGYLCVYSRSYRSMTVTLEHVERHYVELPYRDVPGEALPWRPPG